MKMTKTIACSVCVLAVAATAAAQTSKTSFSTYLQNAHKTMKLNLVQSAEAMPADAYGFRPAGVATEVRTWGQFIGHLTDANNSYCAAAKGDKPGSRPSIEDKSATMSKAELVKALTDALTYCDAAYDQATDASLMQPLTIHGRNGATREATAAQYLVMDLAHNNEHYGNLVTYMRAKGIVPPSTARQRTAK
ncbi:MAG TPA: DinB family protein [Vicinamibacterales bacterium]|nr:DinB family protein [Vicinamibacterales bacterium]